MNEHKTIKVLIAGTRTGETILEELHLAVLGLTKQDGVSLARRYTQAAIVYADRNNNAELIWIEEQ